MVESRPAVTKISEFEAVLSIEEAVDEKLAFPAKHPTRVGFEHGRGERHAIAAGIFAGCDLDGRAHGCLANNSSEERVPLLVRWEVNEDVPYLHRRGVDV